MEARPGITDTPKGLFRTFGPALLMGAVMWAILITGTLAVL